MKRPPLTLPSALYGLILVALALFIVVGSSLLYARVRSFQDTAMSAAIEARTAGAAQAFAQALAADWDNVASIAASASMDDADTTRALLDVASNGVDRVSWAGVADTSGRIVAASDGLLEGQDVSGRPWFLRGLRGDFAGDVHEAVLLQEALGSGDDPLRFIDMSAPIRNAAGDPTGVLGFHINAAWAETYLTDMARTLGMELILVGAGGDIVTSTVPDLPDDLSFRGLDLARIGSSGASYDVWPDGREYFSYILSDVTAGDMPSFGWRLVGRIDPATFLPTSPRALFYAILSALAAAGLSVVIACALFVAMFLRPIAAMSLNAERIAADSDEYPMEITRTDELRRLSAALARLQSRDA